MSDTKKLVEKYIAENGFPFEMQVAREFMLAGFEVYQSSLYIDPETNKVRELDIIASYTRYITNEIQFNFKILIECKHAPTPWILFSGENPGLGNVTLENFYGANFAGSKMLEIISNTPKLWPTPPFRLNDRMCYGLTELSKSGGNSDSKNSFKAVMTLINTLKFEQANPTIAKGKLFEFYIPLIALEGHLFECYLEGDETVVNKIDNGQLLYKTHVFPSVFPLIDIISKDKIPHLAKKLYADLDRITQAITIFDDILKIYPTDFIPIASVL